MYVTRECVEQIGPMEERFFLFYEDVDWGMRAKRYGLGYASQSLVPHYYSTTIKSSHRRAMRSWLSVYLENRNRIHFIRIYFPRYLVLATVLSFLYAAEYLLVRSPRNFKGAIQGLVAGLRGEIGPPLNRPDGTLDDCGLGAMDANVGDNQTSSTRRLGLNCDPAPDKPPS
jgi:GT2 family glycosyltransferase